MKKVYQLEELDCANCAAKMERAIGDLPGVEEARVNFMSQKLILKAEEDRFEDIIKAAEKVIRRIEPDCRIVK